LPPRVVRGAVSLALLVVALSQAFSSSAQAQDTVDLPQITVRTTKVPTAAEKTAASPPVNVVAPTSVPTPSAVTPSSVTVITAADIQREQRRTLPDALSTVPGLNIVQTGGPGGQTSVFMRGTNSNHVKVLIDGIEVSDPSNPNRSFDFGHMLTEDIARIEVLRGPQSGLYGSDAIGGVISITTKTGKGPPQAVGIVEGGSFGTFNQMGSLRGSQDRFSYSVNVQHFRTADTPVTPDRLLPPGQRANGNFYENETYSTKLGYDVTDNFALNLVARYTEALLRFTSDNGGVPNAQQSTQVNHQFFSRGEAVWTLFDGRFKNYFGFNYTDHWNWNRAPSTALTVTKGGRTKFDWRGVFDVTRGLTFVMGAEKEDENLRTDTFVRTENGNKGASS
jgi:vitamin B12 transporter